MVDGGLYTGDDEEIDQASSTKERSILIYKKICRVSNPGTKPL